MSATNHTYWQGPAEDEAMQDEHGFIWKALLETIDIDLDGKRVLDVGCNRGGFLRLLVDHCAIAEGFGYDPASGAIADALRLAGQRSLRYVVSDTVPAGWGGFDVAVSHEVLYLLRDLPAHAGVVFDALVPGGVYYAVLGVHGGSPLMVDWHRDNVGKLQMPQLYDIDEVAEMFTAVGFDVGVARLAMRFVPVEGHEHDRGGVLDWLDYYYDQKLLLRFSRPRGHKST